MTPERWQRIKQVFQAALELEPQQRARFVAEQCANDAELLTEVESLLSAEESAGDFISRPALDVAAIAELHDDDDPMIGRLLGPYRIQKAIGRGGMGTVYLAARADEAYEKSVAIKMISRGMDTHLVVRRFRTERQILAHLEHPNIARLFDGGSTDDGLPYLVMEYVQGVPIHTYCDDRRLSTDNRLRLFVAACAAVEYAHRKRIVHRDIKPSNILVAANGSPKLLDFGIAKIINPEFGEMPGATLTIAGRMMTPDYASPEQARGKPATASSDVYSLGVLLYELLTGHRPYRVAAHTAEEMARIICEEQPEKPSAVVSRSAIAVARSGATAELTPEAVSATRDGDPERLRRRLSGVLDAIILKALEKDPAKRYVSVAHLVRDIERHLADMPVEVESRGFWRSIAISLPEAARGLLGGLRRKPRRGQPADPPTPKPPDTNPVSPVTRAEPEPVQRARRSFAVLGFKNLSGSPDVAWLATALGEMFTSELAAGEHLRAVPAERTARLTRDVPPEELDLSVRENCTKIAARLAAQLLVHGSYTALMAGSERQIRLDVRLYDAATGEPIAIVAERGSESDLFALVSRTGGSLREKLGVWDASTSEVRHIRAAFPESAPAARLYAEGLAKLRVFDALAARPLLEEAARLDPNHSPTHSALGAAWASLGYDAKAVEEAKIAYELSGGLSREDRLSIEGRYREALREWDKAIDIYLRLWGYFSDDIEYGLRLASVQIVAGKPADALQTVDALRKLPAPMSDDPRIDFAEAEAAGLQADFRRELNAYQRSADKARQQDSRLLLARSLLRLGRAHFNLGDTREASATLQASKDLFAAAGDRGGVAMALNSLATMKTENTTETIQGFHEAMQICREIGDKRNLSSILNNLAISLKDQGKYGEALQLHLEALALRRDIGDKGWQAISLNNIGVVFFEQDRLAEAGARYEESLALCREIGDRRNIVRALHNLSIVLREQGRLREARKLQDECIATRKLIGDKRGGCVSALELSIILHMTGELGEAKRVLEEAIPIAREVQMRSAEAQLLHVRADIAVAQDDLSAARAHYASSMALRQEMEEQRTLFETHVALAALSFEEGRPEEAERRAREVIEAINEQIGTPAEGIARIQLARALLAQNRTDDAAEAIARARVVAGESRRDSIRMGLTLTSARVEAAAGRTAAAGQMLSALIAEAAQRENRLIELEARLAKAEIDGSGIEELQQDALRDGFRLVARKAAGLTRQKELSRGGG